jgi:hypothetical protein
MNAPILLYMSMSLDGFITGPGDRAGRAGRDASPVPRTFQTGRRMLT